jgi:hypothetical protein
MVGILLETGAPWIIPCFNGGYLIRNRSTWDHSLFFGCLRTVSCVPYVASFSRVYVLIVPLWSVRPDSISLECTS